MAGAEPGLSSWGVENGSAAWLPVLDLEPELQLDLDIDCIWPPAASWPPEDTARAWLPGPAALTTALPASHQPCAFAPACGASGGAQNAAVLEEVPESSQAPAAIPRAASVPACKGKGAARPAKQPGGMTRQQLRLQQRRQRELDHARIKGLEQQLCALRQDLEVSQRAGGYRQAGGRPDGRQQLAAAAPLSFLVCARASASGLKPSLAAFLQD